MKNPPDFPSHLPPLPEWPAGHVPVFRGPKWKPNRKCVFLCTGDYCVEWYGRWTDQAEEPAGADGFYYAELVKIESPAEPDYASREYQKSVLDAAWDGKPCQYLYGHWRDLLTDGDMHFQVARAINAGNAVRIKPDPYAELKAAHAAGKVIQCKQSWGGWVDFEEPAWDAPLDHYRIKPEPRMVPLEWADIRPGDVFRNPKIDFEQEWQAPLYRTSAGVALIRDKESFVTFQERFVTFEEMHRNGWLRSRDGSTWTRCEKEAK